MIDRVVGRRSHSACTGGGAQRLKQHDMAGIDVELMQHNAAQPTLAAEAASAGAAPRLSRRSVGAGSPSGGPGAGRDTPVEMR